MAYEDFRTGTLARQAYEFVAQNLSHEWRVNEQMWKFEALGVPELRELAARDAAKADLIIVASDGGELPIEAKAWIEEWLARKCGAVALVALFDCPPERAERAQIAQAYLEGVARRGGMEFFTWPAEWPAGERGPEYLIRGRHWETSGETLLPLALAAARPESPSHWGLNE